MLIETIIENADKVALLIKEEIITKEHIRQLLEMQLKTPTEGGNQVLAGSVKD